MLVSTVDLTTRLTALLGEVAQGREVTITEQGIPVAKLVPPTPSFDQADARRAVAGLRDASRGATLEGIRIRDLVNEGRA